MFLFEITFGKRSGIKFDPAEIKNKDALKGFR